MRKFSLFFARLAVACMLWIVPMAQAQAQAQAPASVPASGFVPVPQPVQNLTALARLDPTRSGLRDTGNGLTIILHLSQPVPYRVFTLENPRRLVVDFSEVAWGEQARGALLKDKPARVADVRLGLYRPGWSRMVVELTAPLLLKTAVMKTNVDTGEAVVTLKLVAGSAQKFAAAAGAPRDTVWDDLPVAAKLPPPIRRARGNRRLVVVLDPGHGGIDPGAERAGLREADLTLVFARALKESLLRRGRYNVLLTRQEDTFVPLEERLSIAHMAGADVFISLHADALAQGRARGATVYTLSKTASDEASALLAERHDRNDLMAGVDLSGQDDVVAGVLMGMARRETRPRSEALARDLVWGLRAALGKVYKHPLLRADFSVLKAPDIPSVLIELGFLSSAYDRKNLIDPAWRARAADGIGRALDRWARADAAQAVLLRK